jgi:amidase
VAAGLTPLDIGLDTLGSIHKPAHHCGIFGMRPTEHRVPLTGAFGTDPIRKFRIMSVLGPMARDVEDLRLALQVIAGPDGQDHDVPPIPWRVAPPPPWRNLRVAWAPTFPGMPITRAISRAVEGLAQELERLGARVEQRLPEVDMAAQARLGDYLFGRIAGTFAPESADTVPTSLDDYFRALQQRDVCIAVWEKFFTTCDVLFCPAGAGTARLRREVGTPQIVDGAVVPSSQEPLLAIPHSLAPITGGPMVVLPLGRNSEGLPFGLQVLGRRWDDERLLAITEVLAHVVEGFQQPPGY